MGLNHGWRGPNIVRDGLVLYLDAGSPNSYQGSGTTWKDISKVNQNNGTLTNGPTYSTDGGGSIVFDGVDDYGDLGTSINFSTYTNGFTIGFWVKVLNTSQTGKYLFSKRNTAGTDNQFSIIYGYVNNTFELYGGASGGASQDIRTNSQISVNDTNWHFLYYTVGATTIGYLDGVVKFTNIYPSLTFVSSTNNNLLTTFNAAGFYGNLSLGNMVLYNRILSSTEITQNFNALRGRYGI